MRYCALRWTVFVPSVLGLLATPAVWGQQGPRFAPADRLLTMSEFQPLDEAAEDDEDVPTIEPQTVVGTVDTPTQPAPATPVISPTQTPIPAELFGGTVRVITSEEIQRSNAISVSELLRRTPGVNVVQTGPVGGLTSVFLRGANSQHTKVMLDGIPLNDPSNASRLFDFGNLVLDNVEQIEVLQGPQSVLYGSDAIGGVINIVTQRGSGPTTATLSAQGGSFSTHREALRVSGGTDQYHYAWTGSWYQTRGFSAALPLVGGKDDDGFEAGSMTGRFGWTPTEDFEIDYSFRWIDSRAQVDDSSFSLGQPPSDDLFRKNLSENFYQRVLLRRSMLDDLIVHQASFSLADFDREDTDDVFPTIFLGQTRKFLYQVDLQLTETNLLSAGVDYLAEDAESIDTTGGARATQNLRGVYVQDQWEISDRWYTTAGFRWDEHSVAGSAQTYRITTIGEVTDFGTRLRGSIGTGFRAPALAENLFPFGNPDLRPETSRGWEYGIDQAITQTLTVGATYFRNDIRNLILFDLATLSLENIGTARTHGMEFTGRWDITPQLFLSGSYTVMDTFDGDTHQPLVRRPRHKGTFAATRRLLSDRASVTLYGVFVGDRTDSRDATVWLDDYALIDLAADYQLTEQIRLFCRAENLLDERYEEITGFASQPLSAFGGAEIRF